MSSAGQRGSRGGGEQWRHIVVAAVSGVLAVALVVGAIVWLAPSSDSDTAAPAARTAERQKRPAGEQAGQAGQAQPPAEAHGETGLPASSTYTTIANAPRDPAPHQATDGIVVHPRGVTEIFDKPAGTAIATIGPTQFGDTWLPVINERAGWVQVLLPSKPNGSTGWLPNTNLQRAHTPYVITVNLASMRLELIRDGQVDNSWTIGIGKPSTPTPKGRTFVLGSFVDPKQQFSPIILPLGSHSETLDSFGGGPGTVAIHTWPTTDVLGTATSHGCIRVAKDALNRLTDVPLGTLVLVS